MDVHISTGLNTTSKFSDPPIDQLDSLIKVSNLFWNDKIMNPSLLQKTAEPTVHSHPILLILRHQPSAIVNQPGTSGLTKHNKTLLHVCFELRPD